MKRLLFVLVTQFVVAQTLFAQLEIETTVPTGFDEAINVGVGTGHFETTITNKGGSENITGIKVSPQGGLNGLEIVPTTATYEYRGTVYSASVTGDLVKTNGSLPLYAGEQITFNYEKRAKCSIVPNASSGYSMQVIDDITVLGTGYSEQTNSYPVLFPGLSVIVPESPYNNINVEYLEEFTDTVTIRNEANAGSVNHLILQMERAKDILSVYNVDVLFNGQRLSFPFSTLQDVRIELNSSDLEHLGFSNGIMPSNSQFQMIVSGRVEKYAATTQVRYSADYKTFGISCNRLRNAEGVKYFQQQYPNPQLAITSNIISTGNYCDKRIVVEFTIENTSASVPSNYLLDMYIDTKSLINIDIESITCNGLPLQISNGRYYLNVLDDLDQDGRNSDYDGKSSITLCVVAKPRYWRNSFQHKLLLNVWGTKINGETYYKLIGGTQQSEDKHSYVTGDATIDSELKKYGKFTFEYYADIWEGERLIDYSVHIKSPDSLINISGQRNGLSMIYDGDYQDSVKACTHGTILYQLLLKTEGCEDNIVILTEASPTIVQRCHGSGVGCYEGNVTEASFDRKEINTCDEVSLQAKGTIAYSCKSDCPKFKSVAVSIEDLSGILPIEISNPLLEGIQPVQTFEYRDGIKAYEFLIPMDECTDDKSFIRKELNFSGNLFVKDHINANRVDANIQVKYILVEADSNGENILHDGTWTWGDMLTVYDPKPTFNISTRLDNCSPGRVEAKLGVGAKTGTPARILITEVELPAQPDFYYEPNGIYATGIPYTLSNLQWQVSQEQERTWTVEGLKPKCAEDGKTNSMKYGVIQYEDFYGTSCQRTVRKENVFGIAEEPYKMPQITLRPTERQQSVESSTTWTLLVENNGQSTAQHVMLRLTPNEENTMTIKIDEVRLNGQICSNLRRFGNSVYVPIEGSFAKSTQKVVTITASYKDCIEYGISTINVESAWSCEELTENNFDNFNCGGTAVLELENMVAVLSAIETYPKEYFNLCEDIPIHLTIDNIGRADLNQMGFGFESIPNVYSITNDIITVRYEGNKKEIANISSIPTSNAVLSQNLLNSNNGAFKANSSLDVDFNIQVACSEDKLGIDKILFLTSGYSNCGEFQERKFAFSPKSKGFEALDSISISGRQISEFEKPQDTASFIACIQNNSSRLVDSAFISVLIPVGYEIVGYTPLQDGTVSMMTESIYSDTLILYQWELTKHSNIQANDSVAIKFDITSSLDCPPSGKISYYGTLKRYMFDCTGDSCLTSRSTNPIYVDLNPKYPLFSAEMIGNSSACVGTNTTYQIQGQGIQSIQWNSPIPYIGNETEITINYASTGEYTIQASVTGLCESKTIQTKTEVLSVPDISIDESKNVTWRKWETEGIKCIDSSLNIENWTIPQIDTCGTYTLTYTEENQCGQSSQDMNLTIFRCCEIEPIVLPDTVFIQWYDEWYDDLTQHVDYQPKDGVFELIKGEAHNMCGEYLFRYTVSQCDTVYSDSVVVMVVNCCGENPLGDIVITDRQGVTTFDVEVLRYYLKHPESLVKKSDEYESYYLQMEDCGGKIKEVELIRCFTQWIDINGDGNVDEKDVDELIKLVR